MTRDAQNRMVASSVDAEEMAFEPQTPDMEKVDMFEAPMDDEEEEEIFDFSAWETKRGDDVHSQPRERMMFSDTEDDSLAEASDDDDDDGYAVDADAGVDVPGVFQDFSAPSSVEGGCTLKYGASAYGATPATRPPKNTGLLRSPRFTFRRLRRGTLSRDETIWASFEVAAKSLGPLCPAVGAARGSARAAARQLRIPARSSPAEELRMTPAPPTQPKPAWRRPSNQAKRATE